MILGQPGDSILSGLAIAAILVGGLGAVFWGLPKRKTPKGKGWLMGGSVAFVVGIFLFSMVGAPVIPGSLTPGVTPGLPGSWGICLTNAGYATVGLGTCPQSMVGVKAVTKVQPGINTTKDGFQNAVRVYFNATITPPAGLNINSVNVILGTGSVPSLTNTSNPSKTAPAIALLAGGQFDVSITPSGGTATNQQQTVAFVPGTAKVVTYVVHFSPITGQLALGQYPVGVTVTFTFVDQNTGVSYGTLSLTQTFT